MLLCVKYSDNENWKLCIHIYTIHGINSNSSRRTMGIAEHFNCPIHHWSSGNLFFPSTFNWEIKRYEFEETLAGSIDFFVDEFHTFTILLPGNECVNACEILILIHVQFWAFYWFSLRIFAYFSDIPFMNQNIGNVHRHFCFSLLFNFIVILDAWAWLDECERWTEYKTSYPKCTNPFKKCKFSSRLWLMQHKIEN